MVSGNFVIYVKLELFLSSFVDDDFEIVGRI
jgi:hypothetical protein